jgi:TRAP-type C4-dicarboxylate transport system substrate-binding protein
MACLPLRLVLMVLALGLVAGTAAAQAPPVPLRIVGGLANVSQFLRFEQPFWEQRIGPLTQGRFAAEIVAFDRSGLRAQEMLPLMRLGVVPFGNVLLGVAAADEPEFNLLDLPVLNPDFATLRENAERVRPHLAALLRERYGIELLAIYTYPAQVLFCRRPFTGLGDLAGRRIRTSGVAQSEMVEALRAIPVVTAFSEVVAAVRAGMAECAITGTLSGNAIGLHEVTSHVHAMAISWGLSVFGASRAAWAALTPEDRAMLRAAIATLERDIWQGAERETGEGLACNAGQPGCTTGRPGRMQIVADSPADARLRTRLLRETVVPRWIERCGAPCAESWNSLMAPAAGFTAHAP